MLAIRLQRTGRSGHSQFRLIAQDSRFSPKRGRIVAYLGSYNPHTKEVKLDSQKVAEYLENGAQPSESAAKLLQKEGVKLPGWAKTSQPKQGLTRNPDKRRSTRPAEPEAPAEAPSAEAPTDEAPAEEPPAADTAGADEPAPAEAVPSAEPPAEPAADQPAEPAEDKPASE